MAYCSFGDVHLPNLYLPSVRRPSVWERTIDARIIDNDSMLSNLRDSTSAGRVLCLNAVVGALDEVIRTLAHEVVAPPIEGGVVRVSHGRAPGPTLHVRALPFASYARADQRSKQFEFRLHAELGTRFAA